MSKFTLRMNSGWDKEVLSSTEARDLVEFHTADIAALAIKEAPKASHKNNWNAVKNNIEAMVTLYDQWYGQVVIEFDKSVRHTLLQDQGWTDRAGRRHPGRFFLKKALEKARIE